MTPITQEAEAIGSKVPGLSGQHRELCLKIYSKKKAGDTARGKAFGRQVQSLNSIPSMGMEAESEKEEEGKEQRDRGTEGRRLQKENSSICRVLNYSFLNGIFL